VQPAENKSAITTSAGTAAIATRVRDVNAMQEHFTIKVINIVITTRKNRNIPVTLPFL
jgi:hypothetical protein